MRVLRPCSNFFFFLILVPFLRSTKTEDIPAPWRVLYYYGGKLVDLDSNSRFQLDNEIKHSGKASAKLTRIHTEKFGSVQLGQSIEAGAFKGKRIKISAWIKAEDVFTAHLSTRIYGPDSLIAFAYSYVKRPIRESHDWKPHYVIVDVPDEATQIDFTSILIDEGSIWLDDFAIEVVENNVPTDDDFAKVRDRKFPVTMRKPTKNAINLGFEE